jgi:hypothetical protein
MTIMTTAVISSRSPAAAVSSVDLDRAPFMIAFIVAPVSPSDSPSDVHSTDCEP